jgi:tetratricopeptide (TPR) repeat protein
MLGAGKDDWLDHVAEVYQTPAGGRLEVADTKEVIKGVATLILAVILVGGPAEALAQPADDPLATARQLYNVEDYGGAIEAARAAADARPAMHHEALLLEGRSFLERYRASAEPEDLADARKALRDVDPETLAERSRVDLLVGLGQALYLDGEYRAAAAFFATALEQTAWLSPIGREKVADWWSTAMDRHAQTRPAEERVDIYLQVEARMETHLGRYPDSSAAPYWMAAAALARGDLDLAWDLAVAAWVRAPFSADKGAALRADIDRLVVRGLVPERTKRLPGRPNESEAANSLLAEWELAKEKWTRR